MIEPSIGAAQAHNAAIVSQSNPGTRPAKAHVAAHDATVVVTTTTRDEPGKEH